MKKNIFNAKLILTTLILFSLLVVANGFEIIPPNEPVKFNSWDVVGPNGGDVRVVAIDPKDKSRVYASTLDGQIHTSADGGKTWRLLV